MLLLLIAGSWKPSKFGCPKNLCGGHVLGIEALGSYNLSTFVGTVNHPSCVGYLRSAAPAASGVNNVKKGGKQNLPAIQRNDPESPLAIINNHRLTYQPM